MILTITPNPAIDVTYRVEDLIVGAVHRVALVTEQPGGKGVNVARVLAQLGVEVTCTGFLGGLRGDELAAMLTSSRVHQAWVRTEQATRRTTAVVGASGVTLLNEPGPVVGADAWQELKDRMASLVRPRDVVVVSGSVAPGTPDAAIASLVAAARTAGASTLVDTSGTGLLAAAAAGATLLKPNDVELREATDAPDAFSGASRLLDLGARAVVVSCGSRGLVAATRADGREHRWRVRPAERLTGNATGAGDAAVAALARALAALPDLSPASLAHTLPAHLADAVALSGAAVLSPTAGVVDLPAYLRMRSALTVENLS